MDIEQEKWDYTAMLVAEDALTQDQCDTLKLNNALHMLYSYRLPSATIDCINWGWSAWLKAKAKAVPQWISIEDQMPDGYLPVLVVNQKGKIRICEWAFYEQEWWKSPHAKPIKSTITHWMPLPEPPTKECK